MIRMAVPGDERDRGRVPRGDVAGDLERDRNGGDVGRATANPSICELRNSGRSTSLWMSVDVDAAEGVGSATVSEPREPITGASSRSMSRRGRRRSLRASCVQYRAGALGREARSVTHHLRVDVACPGVDPADEDDGVGDAGLDQQAPRAFGTRTVVAVDDDARFAQGGRDPFGVFVQVGLELAERDESGTGDGGELGLPRFPHVDEGDLLAARDEFLEGLDAQPAAGPLDERERRRGPDPAEEVVVDQSDDRFGERIPLIPDLAERAPQPVMNDRSPEQRARRSRSPA